LPGLWCAQAIDLQSRVLLCAGSGKLHAHVRIFVALKTFNCKFGYTEKTLVSMTTVVELRKFLEGIEFLSGFHCQVCYAGLQKKASNLIALNK